MALGKDGSVWAWGDASDDGIASTTPTKVIEGRTASELTGLSAVNKTVYVAIGAKAVLTALPVPLIADYATMTWTSGNSGVAAVGSRGVVTGKAKGTATMTATIKSGSGRSYSQEFTVVVDGTQPNGDANGDNAIDVADIATIISYMAGQTAGLVKEQVDVNKDGNVDVADIATVISIMAARARAAKG